MIDLLVPIVASAIFFLLGIPASYFILTKKNLRCVVIPQISMIDIAKNIEKNTEVYYNGKKVKNISSYTVKIINSGFSAITKKHVREAIQILFENNLNILEHKIIDTNTSKNNFKITNKKNISKIEFNLLNRKEYVVIQYIYEGATEKKIPQITAHIENISKIKPEDGIIKGSVKTTQVIFEGFFNALFGGTILLVGLILLLGTFSIEFEENDMNFYYMIGLSVLFIITSSLLIFNGLRKLFKYKNCVIDLSTSGEKKDE